MQIEEGVHKMIVTAAGKAGQSQIKMAEEAAKELGAEYKERNKKSISFLIETYGKPVLVIGSSRYEYYEQGNEPFFFHPNSSAFRLKRLMNGENDPFINAAGLQKGNSFLDCTLGLGADSIVASYITGEEGSVTGIEKNPMIGYLVRQGLTHWHTPNPQLEKSMKRINVHIADHLSYLKTLKDRSVDVIYFDPMFSSSISESSGIEPLRRYAEYDEESLLESIEVAKRAAKKRVVFKDHYSSPRFETFGFKVDVRPSSKQQYGIINVE
ncbi:class I SAM-dependent methyltransferase [Jeotgalibacillus sp. ET6]|uniref:class I SAM-dependent methyltransferase n=1 Tax=Jeotgalibacillus sp. ET6 TaxID=3037260 RepID=UPI00241834A8|nr:class I SAM-dependent methyltransferase [Jeotgalibacillus sp. ET6]MDG5470577.1 class I SAM-dependent methyltransferase [Jeotgalibacillus sp. ET6]